MLRLPKLLRLLRWHVIHRLPRRDVTVETFNGRLTLDSKEWLIGKYLYVNQAYEETLIRRAIELLEIEGYLNESARAKIVLDVGANIGLISVALLKHNYFARALAFEPAPDNFRLLEHNVNQNYFKNRIRCFPFALSDKAATLALELSPDNSGDNRIRATQLHNSPPSDAFHEHARRTIQVPVNTLDLMLAETRTPHEQIALVWLDIQGHENQFFRGAEKFFTNHLTPVVSEFWAYGILRSGTTRREFCRTLAHLFTHFYLLNEASHERLPIADVDKLFDSHAAPKQMCELVLVRDDN